MHGSGVCLCTYLPLFAQPVCRNASGICAVQAKVFFGGVYALSGLRNRKSKSRIAARYAAFCHAVPHLKSLWPLSFNGSKLHRFNRSVFKTQTQLNRKRQRSINHNVLSVRTKGAAMGSCGETVVHPGCFWRVRFFSAPLRFSGPFRCFKSKP